MKDKLRKIPNTVLAMLLSTITLGLAHAAWNILYGRLAAATGFLSGCLFILTLGLIGQPEIDSDE